MSDIQESIDILTTHRERLLTTKTFEEYRDACCAYIDMLIDGFRADLAKKESKTHYMSWMALKETEQDKPAP